jgi:hypothetical protein
MLVAYILAIFVRVGDAALNTGLGRGFGSIEFFGPTYTNAFFVASCVALAVVFWLAARMLLTWAGITITENDRTRHWPNEPFLRRPRRPPPLPFR